MALGEFKIVETVLEESDESYEASAALLETANPKATRKCPDPLDDLGRTLNTGRES